LKTEITRKEAVKIAKEVILEIKGGGSDNLSEMIHSVSYFVAEIGYRNQPCRNASILKVIEEITRHHSIKLEAVEK